MNIEVSIWIYWVFCTIAMFLIIQNKAILVPSLLSPYANNSATKRNYQYTIGLGWFTTLISAIGYILFSYKTEIGSYHVLDRLIFSVFNGILEQFMFLFWMLVGCYLAKQWFAHRPRLVFISGYLSFAVFSGFIHALFWKSVLPHHEPNTFIIITMLSIMSLVWMWLFWRYKSIIPIMTMHVCLDWIMISHLHS